MTNQAFFVSGALQKLFHRSVRRLLRASGGHRRPNRGRGECPKSIPFLSNHLRRRLAAGWKTVVLLGELRAQGLRRQLDHPEGLRLSWSLAANHFGLLSWSTGRGWNVFLESMT